MKTRILLAATLAALLASCAAPPQSVVAPERRGPPPHRTGAPTFEPGVTVAETHGDATHSFEVRGPKASKVAHRLIRLWASAHPEVDVWYTAVRHVSADVASATIGFRNPEQPTLAQR